MWKGKINLMTTKPCDIRQLWKLLLFQKKTKKKQSEHWLYNNYICWYSNHLLSCVWNWCRLLTGGICCTLGCFFFFFHFFVMSRCFWHWRGTSLQMTFSASASCFFLYSSPRVWLLLGGLLLSSHRSFGVSSSGFPKCL